ncbi:MAG: helix-turn-helix transcriptional regulator [Lachnospiraceae bacterium]|nr:helix-turn-helix transcriptional regulator [Lachnospiraceae bacterium]
MVDFGNTLKTLRLRDAMTQATLAQKLGVTKSVISAYENGLRLPSYDILIHIAKLFNVSTDYLLGIERKQDIDLSGLSEEEISALLSLIKAMKRNQIRRDLYKE